MTSILQYYNILNINPRVSNSELKKQYHKLLLRYHPDKCFNEPQHIRDEHAQLSKEINEAYNVILEYRKNKENFQQYDDMFLKIIRIVYDISWLLHIDSYSIF